MLDLAEKKLPKDLLEKATLRGNEYAWPIVVIPEVIETCRKANLLNIGGQLQFRLPDGATCECYWIDIDTYKSVPENLSWSERVDLAAKIALKNFQEIMQTVDFLKEGQQNFPAHISKYIEDGGDINATICFVWYFSEK